MFNFIRRRWVRWQMRRQGRRHRRRDRDEGLLTRLLAPFRWLWVAPRMLGRTFWLGLRSILEPFIARRRSFADLLWGLPAILVFSLVATVTALGHVRQRDSGGLYLAAGQKTLISDELSTSQLYLQKAISTKGIDTRLALFYLARSYEKERKFVQADSLMSSLAPVDDIGYPAAHRYMALRIDEDSLARPQSIDLDAWKWHLSHADEQALPTLQKAWGDYFMMLGNFKEALTHYRKAAEEDPTYLFQVADVELRHGDSGNVRSILTSAKERLASRVKANPKDIRTRLLLAGSLYNLGELLDTEQLLKDGLATGDLSPSQATELRKFLALVYTKAYDQHVEQIGLDSAEAVAAGFAYLQNALESDPNSQLALARLAEFARGSPEKAEAGRQALRKLIAGGQASAMAHFALGTIEAAAGKQELAMLNMQQGLAINPQLSVLANNLAFLISEQEGGDLDGALQLANQAIDTDPQQPDYLDTRAGILVRQGKLAAAAVDYQRALELAKDPKPYQEKLAELYEKLGDSELAAQYREASESSAQPGTRN
jgi:tetratricopeptide (TPR) repeat protein